MNRCVATNTAGARCIYEATHGNTGHLFADDLTADAYRYGFLAGSVRVFLSGRCGADALALSFAQIEATLPEATS